MRIADIEAVIDREAREAGSGKALEKVNKPGKL
jgi:hypothetical protein